MGHRVGLSQHRGTGLHQDLVARVLGGFLGDIQIFDRGRGRRKGLDGGIQRLRGHVEAGNIGADLGSIFAQFHDGGLDIVQRRGGRGVKGAALKEDDVVDHFFVASTHDWLLFFTNQGRVYRAKVHELPDAGRDARGQHVANLMAFKPDEKIAQVLSLKDYTISPYLVLATRNGLVKKTPLVEYDSPRTGGLIAITLKPGDEVVSAALINSDDELLLVSTKGMSLRFTADDESLRSMGRSTSGVIGMKFRADDNLLTMARVNADLAKDSFVFTATDGGYGKKTPIDEYRLQGRGGIGIKAAKIDENSRGSLVSALVLRDEDEILAITSAGTVMRTPAAEVRQTGRDSMGVRLVNLDEGVSLLSVTKNGEDEISAKS